MLHPPKKAPTPDEIRAALRAVQYARLYVSEDDKRRPHMIQQLLLLADLRVRNGEIPQAESLLREASVIYKEMKQPAPALATTIWTQLALLNEQRGDAAKAAEFCHKAMTDAAASGVLDRPEGVELCYALAKLCLNLGEAPKAAEYSRKALVAQQRLTGEESYPTAAAANLLGQSSQLLGKPEEALQWHERALRILQSHPSPDVAQTQADIKATYRFLSKSADALGREKLSTDYARLGRP
jgi:tetratricopeptide (TPR) repeat protein